MRRITVDLDNNQVIKDEAISGKIPVHQLHEKLPAGVETIETILVTGKLKDIQIQALHLTANFQKEYQFHCLNRKIQKKTQGWWIVV